MDVKGLISKLVPPLDKQFITGLIDEFINMERRFVMGDWEPAMLDGGQFAEIAARIIYHVDSGTVNRRKGVDPCLKYIEDERNSNQHSFPSRRSSLHLCKVIRTIYKFRSQRGAIHIDPEYTANELDANMVMGNVRWVISELLRIFWSGATNEIASIVREIIRFDVPAVITIDSRRLVLRTDCTVEEEILLLLHNSGERGMDRKELGESVPKSAPAITNSLRKLASSKIRQIILRNDSSYVLTANGAKRIKMELAEKLTLS